MSQVINEIEIFGIGTWNNMKFTVEDLQEIADNTNKLLSDSKHKPPLKLGHSSNQILKGQSDGDPAMGWINNIKVVANKLVADFIKVPNILVSAFREGLYRQVSVEMRHIDHTGWVLTAVALLGADLPAVKNLNDLEAFLSENFKFDNPNDNEENLCFSTSEPILKGLKMENKEEMDALKAELAELKSKNSEFVSKEMDRKFYDEKQSILAPYDAEVKEGKLTPATRDLIAKALDSQKTNFSENSNLSIPADVVREIATAYSHSLPKGEESKTEVAYVDSTTSSITEKIEIEVAKIQSQTGKSYSDASDLVFKSNPELSARYKQYTIDISQGA